METETIKMIHDAIQAFSFVLVVWIVCYYIAKVLK